MEKPGYITMAQRESNNQWSGSIAAHPPQKILSAKIRWKSSCLFFVGGGDQDSIFLIDYLSKGQNNQRGVLLISAGTIEGHFEGKMLWDCHEGGIVLAR
jgi:hypothetical protein